MHVAPDSSASEQDRALAHRWVGAALVDLGLGAAPRAEQAHRTGRYTIPKATRIEVLEVYCARCRVLYGTRACASPCRTVAARAG
jgi:hypothetical protein